MTTCTYEWNLQQRVWNDCHLESSTGLINEIMFYCKMMLLRQILKKDSPVILASKHIILYDKRRNDSRSWSLSAALEYNFTA